MKKNEIVEILPDAERQLNHEERIIELTKFIFEPIEYFDIFQNLNNARSLFVAVEMDGNDDQPSRPMAFDLMTFHRVITELDLYLQSFPAPDDIFRSMDQGSVNNTRISANEDNIEKLHNKIIPRIEGDIASVNLELDQVKEELFIERYLRLYSPTVPVGYLYTQYKDELEPTSLWLKSLWQEVQTTDAYTLWRCTALGDPFMILLSLFFARIQALEAEFDRLFPDFEFVENPEDGENPEEDLEAQKESFLRLEESLEDIVHMFQSISDAFKEEDPKNILKSAFNAPEDLTYAMLAERCLSLESKIGQAMREDEDEENPEE